MSEILRVENLVQQFELDKGFLDKLKIRDGRINFQTRVVKAVNGISFAMKKGEAFGLVGESGCGKSTTARSIIGLNRPTSGKIYFEGRCLNEMNAQDRFALHKQMQMIFQDPYSSLNPRMTVKNTVMEPILFHHLARDDREALELTYASLERVGIRPELAERYPHQFSGGQRQRIGIARALAVNPQFVIADEPVSALDVSIQAQILNLMMDLKDERNLSYLFIAHDLSVVRHICSRLAVMYMGKIVEMGSCEQIFENPLHPYTKLLLAVAPKLIGNNIANYEMTEKEIPNVLELPDGCAFCGRCKYATERCREFQPALKTIDTDHMVSCYLYGQD